MIQVVKRDKEVAEFSLNKITEAIRKAFRAMSKNYNNEILGLLSLRVTADFQDKMKDGRISVEEIQDSVEHVPERAGCTNMAKAYVLYGKRREEIQNMNSTTLDYKDVVNSYVKMEDWRVREDSTVTYFVGGLILSSSGAITTNRWLSEAYDQEITGVHRGVDIHIHDLSMLIGYCAGWSLKQLLVEDLGDITGKITLSPAKHLSVFRNQTADFLGTMQSEWAGAQASSFFDTYLAPFVKTNNLSYPKVKECIKSFIYGVNTPSHQDTQTSFSNITLDWAAPDDIAKINATIGGRETDFKYKDCKKEMDLINKTSIGAMIEGDANEHGFQYLIPTYSITNEFDQPDTENNRLLFEMTSKYGTPCFSNYINSDMQPSDVRSMCCRLRLSLRELCKKTGGFFDSGESAGSMGAVTINVSRIAYQVKDEVSSYARLNHVMDVSARSLKTKRQVITKLLSRGLYPYTRKYLGTLKSYFSAIGLIGMSEIDLNVRWVRKDVIRKECQEFTKNVLNHMGGCLLDHQELYGNLYNLGAMPVESITYRLAKRDKQCYPNIVAAGEGGDTPHYTNSSHLPVDCTEDVFGALDVQGGLQTLYTSGAVFHAFLSEKIPDRRTTANLVCMIAENYRLPYYTLSPTYPICECHGYLIGEYPTCPICGERAEVYGRIIGYYRPVQS